MSLSWFRKSQGRRVPGLLGCLALTLVLVACGRTEVGGDVTLRLPNLPQEVQAVTFAIGSTEYPASVAGNPRAATLERTLPAGNHEVVVRGLDQPNGVVLYKGAQTITVPAGGGTL
jgi:hypothetical protein